MKDKNIYTVDYFIEKFEKIPEQLWCTGTFFNGEQRCAQGHCMKDWYDHYNEESNALRSLFPSKKMGVILVGQINNGDDKRYQQPTPKQRILAALYDIKALQQPAYTSKTKHISFPTKEEKQSIPDSVVRGIGDGEPLETQTHVIKFSGKLEKIYLS